MLEKLDKFLLLTAETSPTYLLTQSDKGAHKDKTKSKDFDKTKPNFPDGETDQIDASKANNCNGFHQ